VTSECSDRDRRHLITGGLALLGAARPAAARAQASLDAISLDPRVQATQLRRALELSQRAVREFQQLGPEQPFDQPLRTMNQVYVLIRAARSGMVDARGAKKFHDPVDDLVIKKVTDAWNMARRPLDDATSAIPRDEYIALSVRHMNATAVHLQTVVPLLP
jgi:hypothetical protein